MPLKTAKVPTAFEGPFLSAEEIVTDYFRAMRQDPPRE